MKIEIFKTFRQFVGERGVLFYYNGYLSQPIVSAMGESLRSKLEVEDASAKTARRVFSAFVEMMQNIIHYANADDDQAGDTIPFGNVAVGRQHDSYYIVSGNSVANLHVDRLSAKLDAIRAMSNEEIKAEYKRQLRADEQDDNSQGAGLGFLTVARDASQPIEYLFEPFPGAAGSLSFFYLKATI